MLDAFEPSSEAIHPAFDVSDSLGIPGLFAPKASHLASHVRLPVFNLPNVIPHGRKLDADGLQVLQDEVDGFVAHAGSGRSWMTSAL